jgi:hypothetical protein
MMIIMDVSGSMTINIIGSQSRLDVAKAAVKSVVATLSNADWLGFVGFSTSAKVYSNKLIRAS